MYNRKRQGHGNDHSSTIFILRFVVVVVFVVSASVGVRRASAFLGPTKYRSHSFVSRQYHYDSTTTSTKSYEIKLYPSYEQKYIPIRWNETVVFDTTNVICIPSSSSSSSSQHIWELIVPKHEKPKMTTIFDHFFSFQQGDEEKEVDGIDVTVEFTNPMQGAKDMIHQIVFANSTTTPQWEMDQFQQEIIQNELVVLFHEFQRLALTCPNRINTNTTTLGCKARIVSSIGNSGTKCPRWHIDHVPIRLVTSLYGPGCVYIPHESEQNNNTRLLNRHALNHLEEEDSQIANSIIVSNSHLENEKFITYSKTGDAVYLMGSSWKNSNHNNNNKNTIRPVAHKSPIMKPNQGRVLLTVDMLPTQYFLVDDHDDC